jgi:hypothetical protein
MKINKRQVPLDILSLQDKRYRVYVGAEGMSAVQIRVDKDGVPVHDQRMTFDQFVSLLMR